MLLQPSAFNSLFSRLGQRMAWRKSYACPCISPTSKAAATDCKRCYGKGRIWIDAVSGHGGAAGAKAQREWELSGLWMSGDTVITIPENSALYDIGELDRVTMMNSTLPFSLVLVRGKNDVLRFECVSVDRVFTLNADKTAEIDYPLPTINPDGSLEWGSDAPPAGATFSTTGRRRPEYFVYQQMPSDRAHQFGARLPRRVILRLFDLFGR